MLTVFSTYYHISHLFTTFAIHLLQNSIFFLSIESQYIIEFKKYPKQRLFYQIVWKKIHFKWCCSKHNVVSTIWFGALYTIITFIIINNHQYGGQYPCSTLSTHTVITSMISLLTSYNSKLFSFTYFVDFITHLIINVITVE